MALLSGMKEVKYERSTEPVQVDISGKVKVQMYLLKLRKKGERITIGEYYSLAAEEKLKRDKGL